MSVKLGFYNHNVYGMVELEASTEPNSVDVVYFDKLGNVTYAEHMSEKFIESCVANGVLTWIEDQFYCECVVKCALQYPDSKKGWIVMARKTGDLARRLRINQGEFQFAGPFWADEMGYFKALDKANNIVACLTKNELQLTECELRKWVVSVSR